MAHIATTDADDIHYEIGCEIKEIKSFNAKATISYKKGDFVTIDTAGRVVKASTDGQIVDGIVDVDIDNTDGANDALQVPVLLKGNVLVDGLFNATSGAFDDPIAIGSQLGVAGDGGTTAAEAQALVLTPGGANSTLFTSLTVHAIPTATAELVTVLAYFRGSSKFA